MKHSITGTLVVAVLVAVVAAGCSQHGDPLAEHAFIPAPTPTNVQILDNGNGTYDVTWSVDDDSAVKNYRVYVINGFGQWELWQEPANAEIGIDLATGIPVGGIPIGITAVTVENVEGAMAVVVTPAPGGGL